MRAERRACSAECTRRADLWGRTADGTGTEAIRYEARCRTNEALYLADALATRR